MIVSLYSIGEFGWISLAINDSDLTLPSLRRLASSSIYSLEAPHFVL